MNFRICSAFILFIAISSPAAYAMQNIQFQIGAPTESVVADSEEAMQELLQLRINEMEEVLSLETAQTRKLSLAASTVTKKVFAERMALQVPGPNGLPQPAQSASDKPNVDSLSDEDAERKQHEAAVVPGGQMFFVPVEMDKVLKHELWLKSVDSILTPKQKELRETKQKEQDEQMLNVAVEYRVIQLSEQLRLKPSQIKPISEVIRKVEGEQLVKDLRRGNGQPVLEERKKIRSEDVASILTESQLKQLFQTKPLNPIEKMLFGNAAAKGAVGFGVTLDESLNEAIVKEVDPKSVAAKLGLQAGDTIDSVDGKPIDTRLQCERALQKSDIKKVDVLRSGKTIRLENKQ